MLIRCYVSGTASQDARAWRPGGANISIRMNATDVTSQASGSEPDVTVVGPVTEEAMDTERGLVTKKKRNRQEGSFAEQTAIPVNHVLAPKIGASREED